MSEEEQNTSESMERLKEENQLLRQELQIQELSNEKDFRFHLIKNLQFLGNIAEILVEIRDSISMKQDEENKDSEFQDKLSEIKKQIAEIEKIPEKKEIKAELPAKNEKIKNEEIKEEKPEADDDDFDDEEDENEIALRKKIERLQKKHFDKVKADELEENEELDELGIEGDEEIKRKIKEINKKIKK